MEPYDLPASVPPPRAGREQAWIADPQAYAELCRQALADLPGFWEARSRELLDWQEPYTEVLVESAATLEAHWFPGGRLNVSQHCLDRHLAGGDKMALLWQGEDDGQLRRFSYRQLHEEVCRFANVLKKHGVGPGDRVAIFLPMVPELVISMLACARIGAIHAAVFAGFSPHSLQGRIEDLRAETLITADGSVRAGRTLPLKQHLDGMLADSATIRRCFVVNRLDLGPEMQAGRDFWFHEETQAADIAPTCEPLAMAADDPLFILYTSGSTGQPKGVVHRSAGYLLYAMHTAQLVFDLKPGDVHWCTADIGWITGHTYSVYGPLGLGATTLLFEGVPSYPGPDRYWQVVEKHRVTTFYTAPTVIRALMRYGPEPVDIHDVSSLRLLGSVGEPIAPEAWLWYHRVVGRGRLPLVDTWWQTESGGVLISALPYVHEVKPGSASRPLPGIDAAVVDDEGREVAANTPGRLIIRRPWPGMYLGIFGDNSAAPLTRDVAGATFFATGDGARCDEDGDFWITGRVDDVMNVSGHRLGTAEVEAALASFSAVSEAAVVGLPDSVKGQVIYAYVTLGGQVDSEEELVASLRQHVRQVIGPIAVPDHILCVSALPKTRSGKLMRRVLRRIAADECDDLGDTSALADPAVLAGLIQARKLNP